MKGLPDRGGHGKRVQRWKRLCAELASNGRRRPMAFDPLVGRGDRERAFASPFHPCFVSPPPPPPPLPLRGIVDFGERPKSGGASYRFLEYLIFETEPLENN